MSPKLEKEVLNEYMKNFLAECRQRNISVEKMWKELDEDRCNMHNYINYRKGFSIQRILNWCYYLKIPHWKIFGLKPPMENAGWQQDDSENKN